jgi:hypothetical protein
MGANESTNCVRPVYQTSDTTYQSPKLDVATHALLMMDQAHHEIHAGDHFFVSLYDADVDTGGPKYLRLTTPNTTKWAHLVLRFTSSGAGLWQLYENPTLNATGTAVTIFNSNRNSSTAATVTAFEDTTTTSDGTLLFSDITGANGIGGTQSSGTSGREAELILKQNEDYVLKFTPDADNAKVVILLEWYEHTSLSA